MPPSEQEEKEKKEQDYSSESKDIKAEPVKAKAVKINSEEVKKEKKVDKEELVREGEVDLASLSDEELDEIILEMHAEEMMEKSSASVAEAEVSESPQQAIKTKKKRKRKREKRKTIASDIAPGFGKVAIKMSVAMTLSMTFIFLGPLFVFMGLFRAFGTVGKYDIWDLVFSLIGVGLTVAAYFLFRYIISER